MAKIKIPPAKTKRKIAIGKIKLSERPSPLIKSSDDRDAKPGQPKPIIVEKIIQKRAQEKTLENEIKIFCPKINVFLDIRFIKNNCREIPKRAPHKIPKP